jgi:TolB-like protein
LQFPEKLFILVKKKNASNFIERGSYDMRFSKNCTKLMLGVVVSLLCCDLQMAEGLAQWHVSYKNGLKAMERGDWNGARGWFADALRTKGQESKKARAGGVMFIEYFPHREIGICYFHLGDIERAKQELSISLAQEYSDRAQQFLQRIARGERPAGVSPSVPTTPPPSPPVLSQPQPVVQKPPESAGSTLVGERLSIAVLPFESKGIGGALGNIDLLDKLIAGFVNTNRFKVIERAQLEKILEEQKLGLSGILDASTAAQIGKGMGVDAVMCGSVTQGGNAVTIDARLIDTETAAIMTARDAFSNGISLPSLSQMISDLAAKIKMDFPLVNGYVIGVRGDKVTIDIGNKSGLKKGTKCHIYREGAPIVHPVTNEVIGKMIDESCEVQITEIFDAYSVAVITKPKSGTPTIRDKVITK